MAELETDVSVIPGLYGPSEQAAFRAFIEEHRQRLLKKHGRYGAVGLDTSGLYQAWSAGRIYEKFEVPKIEPALRSEDSKEG